MALGTAILNTAATMYEARQETLRTEIEYRSEATLAAALARCIDDAHVKAQKLPGSREIEEAARVRASARQFLTDVVPPVATVLEQRST